MRRVLLSVICLFAALIFLTGCVALDFSGIGAVMGVGEMHTFEVPVEEFNRVRVSGNFNLIYSSESRNSISLEIQENLFEHFDARVENGELVIRSTRRFAFGFNRPTPTVTVFASTLNGITISGAAAILESDKIIADDFSLRLSGAGSGSLELDVENLETSITGAGDISLSGNADTAELSVSGAGAINALELETRNAAIRFSGAGELSVNASERLSINASGAGSIRYSGNAITEITQSGVVSITRVG